MVDPHEFTAEHRAVLEFEKQWWKYQGHKGVEIQQRLGYGPGRYYRLLNAAIDHPDAIDHDAMLVKRLRRLREIRKAHRRDRRTGIADEGA